VLVAVALASGADPQGPIPSSLWCWQVLLTRNVVSGIREFPAPARERSKALVTKYIKDRDTLVLAVAPAMTPRLTSNQGIGLVIDTGKQAKTVIALTMTDLVQRENLKVHVMDRLLRRTDELENHSFGGVVAVINRLHTDTEILADAAEREAAWFRALLASTPKDYKPHMQAISSAVTVSSVIRHLDELYDRHIREDWQPRALKVIDGKIEQQKAEIAALGTPPEKLYVKDVVDEALMNFSYVKVEAR
jgi:hypothetical protein